MEEIAIETEMTADTLRALGLKEKNRRAGRRMQAIANELDGCDRQEAARLAGMSDQALRDAIKRFTFAYVFAAVKAGSDEAFALVMPEASPATMQEFLDRFAVAIADYEHIAMVLDQASWHCSGALRVPNNITLVPLPPAVSARIEPAGARLAPPERALPFPSANCRLRGD